MIGSYVYDTDERRAPQTFREYVSIPDKPISSSGLVLLRGPEVSQLLGKGEYSFKTSLNQIKEYGITFQNNTVKFTAKDATNFSFEINLENGAISLENNILNKLEVVLLIYLGSIQQKKMVPPSLTK